MDDVLLVQTVLDLTSLGIGDGLADIGGNSAGLRVGHQTTGAQNLTETANAAHHVRGGDQNIEVEVTAGDLGDQIVIADLLSACSLSGLGSVALGDGDDADILAGAVGQDDSAANLLVSVAAVNAQTDMQLNGLVELSGSGLAAQLQGFGGIVSLIVLDQLSSVDILLAVFHCVLPSYSALNGNAHAAGGALDHADSGFQRSSVQVGHLGLGDLLGLCQRDGANLVLVGHAGSSVDAGSLLDQNGRRRGLGDEGEGAVSVNSDDNGDDHAHLVLGTLVELLGERHDVDALLTQSRTNRGSRSCLAGGDLQLDVASDFLCHNTCTSKFCGELRPAVQTSHGRATSAHPIKTVPRGVPRSRPLPETGCSEKIRTA